ncbi:MAG TPA: amidohydrolase family protein [Usitatibacter sp.]|nr:amidohydrolase family protein [Usitatibacter sp.]
MTVGQRIVANSAGTARPRLAAPRDACDCHLHVYDPAFPMARPDARAVSDASAAEYRALQARLGTSRAVVVQPAAYGTDNRVTVDAVGKLGREHARGIAVIHPDVGDTDLRRMTDAGIRGVRFTQHDPRTAVTTPEMIEPVAARVAALGWHVQIHLLATQIVALRDVLLRLPGTIVLDHMARLPQPEGTSHAAWDIVKKLLDTGRAWVKLSGAYLESREGPPRYSDVLQVARAFVAHAPERCVWGSDWPHPTERDAKPDDAVLFDLLGEWAGDEGMRQRILVENPRALYGFS